jgi:hypothetical protein
MRCCCGKLANADIEDGPVMINGIVHEVFGEPGNFCGPIDKHVIRTLQSSAKRQEEMLAEAQEENRRLRDAAFSHIPKLNRITSRWRHRREHALPHEMDALCDSQLRLEHALLQRPQPPTYHPDADEYRFGGRPYPTYIDAVKAYTRAVDEWKKR